MLLATPTRQLSHKNELTAEISDEQTAQDKVAS